MRPEELSTLQACELAKKISEYVKRDPEFARIFNNIVI